MGLTAVLTGVVATSVVGIAATTALIGEVEWNSMGPASVFNDVNWAPQMVPGVGDRAFVRNDGRARADGTAAGNPTTWVVDGLTVGDQVGTGEFEAHDVSIEVGPGGSFEDLDVGVITGANRPDEGMITGVDGRVVVVAAPSLRVAGAINVSELRATGSAMVQGDAVLYLERINSVDIGGDFDVGAHFLDTCDGAVATGHATVSVRNVDSFVIGDDFDITDGDVNNDTGLGRGIANHSATVLVEWVDYFSIGSDLDVGKLAANANETENVLFDVTWRDVGLLEIDRDIDYLLDGAHGVGPAAGELHFDGTMTFDRSTVMVHGDIDLHNTVNMSGDGVVEARGTMNLIDSSLTVEGGDTAEFGAIDFADGDPGGTLGGGDPGNWVEAFVNLTRSSLTAAGGTKLGRRLNGVPGDLDAVIELKKGSLLDTGMLEVGDEGVLGIHVGGLTRVTPGTVGAPGTYSAIDASDALLGGEFLVDFDFPPPVGTHTFDLLVTDAPGTLADTTANFGLMDLPSWCAVDFYGVVQDGGVDRVRLIITCGPAVLDCFDVEAFRVCAFLKALLMKGAIRAALPTDPSQEEFLIEVTDLGNGQITDFVVPVGGMMKATWTDEDVWWYETPPGDPLSFRFRINRTRTTWRFDNSRGEGLDVLQGPNFRVRVEGSVSGEGSTAITTNDIPPGGWGFYVAAVVTDCALIR